MPSRSTLSLEHDLVRKPVSTFRDHALGRPEQDPGMFPRYLRAARQRVLERDDFSSDRHLALLYCWSMIFSENRYPLFGIMLWHPSAPHSWRLRYGHAFFGSNVNDSSLPNCSGVPLARNLANRAFVRWQASRTMCEVEVVGFVEGGGAAAAAACCACVGFVICCATAELAAIISTPPAMLPASIILHMFICFMMFSSNFTYGSADPVTLSDRLPAGFPAW